MIYNRIRGRDVPEKHPEIHVRGATKIYRRACWDDIDGLHCIPEWDTLDELEADQVGWKTRSFASLKIVQLHFTGDAAGQWGNWVKNGRGLYICGYHPLYLLAKAVARAVRKPYLIATSGVVWGYFTARSRGIEKIPDPSLVSYLRTQQLRRLFGLKSVWR